MHHVTLESLEAVEHDGWLALSASRGGAFYGTLMLPDAMFVLVDGSVLTRDEVVASLDGAPEWSTFEISDTRMIDLGGEAAALVYRAIATRADLDQPFIALMSSVYRRVDGRLRLSLYQQTAVPS